MNQFTDVHALAVKLYDALGAFRENADEDEATLWMLYQTLAGWLASMLRHKAADDQVEQTLAAIALRDALREFTFASCLAYGQLMKVIRESGEDLNDLDTSEFASLHDIIEECLAESRLTLGDRLTNI